MKFCVNCGTPAIGAVICKSCGSDPRILFSSSEYASGHGRENRAKVTLPYGYPGEHQALLFSSAVFVLVIGFFGVFTFGIFIILVVMTFLRVRFALWQLRGNAVKVNAETLPYIHSMVNTAAFRLRCAPPECFIVNMGLMNAYSSSDFEKGFIVLSSEIVDAMDAQQLAFVIGHEIGHIERRHTMMMNVFAPARGGVSGGVIRPLVNLVFNVWSVKAEYTADRAGLLAARDVDAAISALLTLSSGAVAAREWQRSDELVSRGERSVADTLTEYSSTHPLLRNRIEQLRKFSVSDLYKDSA
jgi:Zn-dependent protease with chaperone function